MENNSNFSQKFFLYCRKSTDVEDKQALSIEAQVAELRAFAKQEKLEIIEEFIEKQTAKIPGRPIFNQMMEKIEKGEANGILAWHPDRLARNSVDGGKIIYLLDTGKLQALKFPQFWFESTPQGKFMLSITLYQKVRNYFKFQRWRGKRPHPLAAPSLRSAASRPRNYSLRARFFFLHRKKN